MDADRAFGSQAGPWKTNGVLQFDGDGLKERSKAARALGTHFRRQLALDQDTSGYASQLQYSPKIAELPVTKGHSVVDVKLNRLIPSNPSMR